MTAQHSLTVPHPARLSVKDFLLLDRSGAFDGYAKTELINGTIIVVNAQFGEHLTAKIELLLRLNEACNGLGGGLRAWSEGSIDMSPDSMPEPDLFITNVRPSKGAVQPGTVMLIGEVSDATLDTDLGTKADLYAAHGVPEYWVVDIQGGKLHQLWQPGKGGYAERRTIALGSPVESATIPGLTIATNEL